MRYNERKKCPFFLFVQNPRAAKDTGAVTCNHASPNIGKEYRGRIEGIKKHCDEGEYISQSHSKKCRILTNFLKESSYQETLV